MAREAWMKFAAAVTAAILIVTTGHAQAGIRPGPTP
jgi:hypothetical protein